jgi:hypothetical protein
MCAVLPVPRLDSRHWHTPERPSRGQMLFDLDKCPTFSLVGTRRNREWHCRLSHLPLPYRGKGREPVMGKGRVLGTRLRR